uniref:TonB-dependent receptor n=1 Tax=Steinernema glaseri TaxID=37863 RepID=A0A1I7Z9J0_9BILA
MKVTIYFLLISLCSLTTARPSLMVENRANIENISFPRQITPRARLETEFPPAAKVALGIGTRVKTAFYDSFGNTMDQAIIRIPPAKPHLIDPEQKSILYNNPLPLAFNSDIVSSTFKPSKFSNSKRNVLIVFRRSEPGLI